MLEQLKLYRRQKKMIARQMGIAEKDVQDAIEEILSIIKANSDSATITVIEDTIRNNPDSELAVYVDTNNPDKLTEIIVGFSSYFDYVFSRDGKRYEFNVQV